MLIDTHAHLFWNSYTLDFDAVLQRALERGVSTIINIGTDLTTSQQALELSLNEAPRPASRDVISSPFFGGAKSTEAEVRIHRSKSRPSSAKADEANFYSTVGLHPDEASNFNSKEKLASVIKSIENIYHRGKEKIVGIGECGLDYYFHGNSDFIPTDLTTKQLITLQKKLFKAQVNLAKSLKLPLIIHCREAWKDIFIAELSGTRGVFHNFSSNLEDAKKVLKLGFYLSFSCIITYPKNEHLRQVVRNLPLDKILIETDCPFLPPQSIRGQRNEPSFVAEVAKTIAQVRNLSFDQVADATSTNAKTLFSI